jgi:hypothetical protein
MVLTPLQLSQKLYKVTSNPKYIFWTVSSMLHQLDTLPVAMLDLAEKMVMKILSDKALPKGNEAPGAEELKLLVDILRKRAAHSSTPLTLKCQLLERALEQIRDLSSRSGAALSDALTRLADLPWPQSTTTLPMPKTLQL